MKPNITNLPTQSSRAPQSLNGNWNIPLAEEAPKVNLIKDDSPATTVNLSTERKARSIDYGATLKQPRNEIAKQEEINEGEDQGDLIDKKMERIEEEMTEIREQLALLQGDKSETAKNLRELLNTQLMTLATQLMELASQKLKG